MPQGSLIVSSDLIDRKCFFAKHYDAIARLSELIAEKKIGLNPTLANYRKHVEEHREMIYEGVILAAYLNRDGDLFFLIKDTSDDGNCISTDTHVELRRYRCLHDVEADCVFVY